MSSHRPWHRRSGLPSSSYCPKEAPRRGAACSRGSEGLRRRAASLVHTERRHRQRAAAGCPAQPRRSSAAPGIPGRPWARSAITVLPSYFLERSGGQSLRPPGRLGRLSDSPLVSPGLGDRLPGGWAPLSCFSLSLCSFGASVSFSHRSFVFVFMLRGLLLHCSTDAA